MLHFSSQNICYFEILFVWVFFNFGIWDFPIENMFRRVEEQKERCRIFLFFFNVEMICVILLPRWFWPQSKKGGPGFKKKDQQ